MLAQSWPRAIDAWEQCLTRGPEVRRSHAYANLISAQVQMKKLSEAQKTSLAMLHAIPYDAEVATSILNLKSVLEYDGNLGRTLELEIAEQPAILAAIRRNRPLTEEHGDAFMPIGTLYASAMQLAFLQHYNQDKQAALETVASLDAAVNTASLNNEDAALIQRARAGYGLLDSKLPPFRILQALESSSAKASIPPDYGLATVFVLFPDWCAGCREQMKIITEFSRINEETPIHAYGLVFHDDFGVPEDKPAVLNWADLEGTVTYLVEPETVLKFGAVDYPFGLLVDHSGAVRFAGVLPDSAFNGSGYIERVIQRAFQER